MIVRIVRIVPIVPVVSKNFETIGTTETIADFPYDRPRSLQILETHGRQRCSWVRQQSFGAIFGNEMADINRGASLLACYLLILSILRRGRARTIPRSHRFWVWQPNQITELWWRGDSIAPTTRWNILFFSQVSPIRGSDILIFFFLLQPPPTQISLLLLSRYSSL